MIQKEFNSISKKKKKSLINSDINFARRRSKKRQLPHEASLQTHQQIARHVDAVTPALDGSGLVPQFPRQHQPQPHHPVPLVHLQRVAHLRLHRHRSSSQQRRQGHRALGVLKQRRQDHGLRDGNALVGDVGREGVVEEGDALVGVPSRHRELHGGGYEGRGGGVELVHGGAHHSELRVVGPID